LLIQQYHARKYRTRRFRGRFDFFAPHQLAFPRVKAEWSPDQAHARGPVGDDLRRVHYHLSGRQRNLGPKSEGIAEGVQNFLSKIRGNGHYHPGENRGIGICLTSRTSGTPKIQPNEATRVGYTLTKPMFLKP
jgi:hypothetical protein